VLFVSSRAFSLSTPTFLLSTPAENSEATWKKATKCNKHVNCYSITIFVNDIVKTFPQSKKSLQTDFFSKFSAVLFVFTYFERA
jgi:hypothetical protein